MHHCHKCLKTCRRQERTPPTHAIFSFSFVVCCNQQPTKNTSTHRVSIRSFLPFVAFLHSFVRIYHTHSMIYIYGRVHSTKPIQDATVPHCCFQYSHSHLICHISYHYWIIMIWYYYAGLCIARQTNHLWLWSALQIWSKHVIYDWFPSLLFFWVPSSLLTGRGQGPYTGNVTVFTAAHFSKHLAIFSKSGQHISCAFGCKSHQVFWLLELLTHLWFHHIISDLIRSDHTSIWCMITHIPKHKKSRAFCSLLASPFWLFILTSYR